MYARTHTHTQACSLIIGLQMYERGTWALELSYIFFISFYLFIHLYAMVWKKNTSKPYGRMHDDSCFSYNNFYVDILMFMNC
jgi:hypothetical protein